MKNHFGVIHTLLIIAILAVISLPTAFADEKTAHDLKVINAKLLQVEAPEGNIISMSEKNSQVVEGRSISYAIHDRQSFEIKDSVDGSVFTVSMWDMDVTNALVNGVNNTAKKVEKKAKKSKGTAEVKKRVLRCMEISQVNDPEYPLAKRVTFFDIYGVVSGKPNGVCTAACDQNEIGKLPRMFQGTMRDIATGNTSAVNLGMGVRASEAEVAEVSATWNAVASTFARRVRALLKPKPSIEVVYTTTQDVKPSQPPSPSPSPLPK